MSVTNIEWADRVWNPVTGCTKVSQGCKHCYAEGVAERFWATQYRAVLASDPTKTIDTISTSHHDDYLANGFARPRRFTDVQTHEDRLLEPLAWRKPARVFVNSMSDLFHEAVPDAFIDQVVAAMALARRHAFLVLTKRPERMRAYLSGDRRQQVMDAGEKMRRSRPPEHWYHISDWSCRLTPWPLRNVWLGVSVEDQTTAAARIPALLETSSAIRFVSYEPALAPVNFRELRHETEEDLTFIDSLTGDEGIVARRIGGPRLDWVIVGGESGPGARPFDIAWARSTVGQCRGAGVPVFVKQLGRVPSSHHVEPGWQMLYDGDGKPWGTTPGTVGRGKHGDPAAWPEDLRVREFPAEVSA